MRCTTHYVILFIIFIAILSAASFVSQAETRANTDPFNTYDSIPGVTDDEKRDIEALKSTKSEFIYGMNESTETFYAEDGSIGGFSALVCEWLTGLFGIKFTPAIYEWNGLVDGLADGTIDFTGELTATDERRQTFIMTDAIAERVVKYMQIEGSVTLEKILPGRRPRFAFLKDTTTFASVSEHSEIEFDAVFVEDYNSAYRLLKTGSADAFFEEGIAEAAFDNYGDIIAYDFLPLIYGPVSISAQNKAYGSIISVVQKALPNGGSRYLAELYNRGTREFVKTKLMKKLDGAEKAYIKTNPTVKFVAEYDNYPVSFYNQYEKNWQGIVFDVLDEVREMTGLTFTLVNGNNTPWLDLFGMLSDGRASMISELIRSEDRENHFLWPDRSILTDNYALISKSDFHNISLNEILSIRIGVIQDSAHMALFENWFPNHSNTVVFDNADEAFNALDKDRIDMMMGSRSFLLMLTNYRELTGYKANIVFDRTYESTLGFNINEATLCSIINKSLSLIDTKSISDRWMRKTFDYRQKIVSSQRPWLIGASLLLLCILTLLLVIQHKSRGEGKRLEEVVYKRTSELEKQYMLMYTVNEAATILLNEQPGGVFGAIHRGLGMIGELVGADRVLVWRNDNDGGYGDKRCKLICKWVRDGLPQNDGLVNEFSYAETLPAWLEIFSCGGIVNGPIDDMPDTERFRLLSYSVQSVLAIPIFLKEVFWGFISFDEWDRRHTFPKGEVHILRSWGLLIVSALLRDEIALDMRRALTKLEAVTNNYKGVIWSVDNNGIITSFKGQYLKALGVIASKFEGKNLYEVILPGDHKPIFENVKKTFIEGPQDWIGEMNGSVFRSYTAPIFDGDGLVVSVIGSTDDVTEIVRLQRDLETAVKAAQAASRAKSDFLANMSHEIRTPMNAIIGMTAIGKNTSENERKDYCLRKIEDASKHLLGVINDILDMSKIEANKFELSLRKFDFNALIEQVTGVINFRIDEKAQKLSVLVDGAMPRYLYGDDQRLAQVITNLLGNAVKFTPEDGEIKLEAAFEGDEGGVCSLKISVADTGIGISPEQQTRLFQSFSQAESSTARKFGGTGLGLSISKNIVNMMGGEIWVESEPGKGSVFTFTVKIKKAKPAAGDAQAADSLSASAVQDGRGKSAQGAPDGKSINFQDAMEGIFDGVQILLAEDVEINREIVVALLEPTMIKIDCAENGAEAVSMFSANPQGYDLILMDVQMPEMDGYEATQKIRETGLPGADTIPILAMTANVFKEDIEKCIESGMNGHVGKPLDINDVIEKIHAMLPAPKGHKTAM